MYTWSNEYKVFTRVQAYNIWPTIKISLQLDNVNCIYELFLLIAKNYRSKSTTKKFVLKHIILYVHYVDLLI